MTDSRHLRDDQLLLHSSGELDEISLGAHLESCAECTARLSRLQNTLGEFTEAQRFTTNAELPPLAQSRARLREHLRALGRNAGGERRTRAAWPLSWSNGVIFASVTLIVVLLTARVWHQNQLAKNNPGNLSALLAEEPNADFTPGAVVATSLRRVCVDSVEAPAVIPAAMKTQVLQLYGIASAQSGAYEVDYLITPELGGATDIRNLWPEPYDHTMWNAHVKDRLEERLREMVCRGDLDLVTAQHDISTDWIGAYRKYFHVSGPALTGTS